MFDTAPIVCFIEEHKDFGKITEEIFSIIKESTDYHAFSSVITLPEVLTQPLRKSKIEIVEKYRQFLSNSKNFTVYSETL